MATTNSELEARREEIVQALARAHPLGVQHSCRVCVSYRPLPEHDPPHPSHTTLLQPGDFIHFKMPYNADWWIGRVVGHETGMTFVPSEAKLMSVRSECGDACVEVYQRAPVMRPIVLLGPTSKESELTRLLHKPLLSYIREKFSGRLLTIKPDQSVRGMSAKEIRVLDGDVFAAASTMNLVLLDSDASYPGDFEGTKLHPHFIYVKIARQKVLQNLIRQLTKSSRDQQMQVEDARYLYDNSHSCSLVVADSNVDDACLNLELFLESYWASTRSVVLLGGGL